MSDKKFSAGLTLWVLLVVGLVIIVGISFIDDIKIGDYTVRKGTFKETLLADIPEEIPADSLAMLDSLALKEEKVVAEPDTTVKSVMIFGDSMTVLIARRLAAYGQQNGFKVHSITWDGSSTIAWANLDTLNKYIPEFKPDFFFVSLGGNELFLKDVDSRIPHIKKIIDRFEGKPFVWVGPPNWKEDFGYNDMLERTLPKGTFFKSDGIPLDRGPDHIHPTPKAGGLWTDSIMRWMAHSAHPILAELPDSTVKNAPFTHIYIRVKRKN